MPTTHYIYIPLSSGTLSVKELDQAKMRCFSGAFIAKGRQCTHLYTYIYGRQTPPIILCIIKAPATIFLTGVPNGRRRKRPIWRNGLHPVLRNPPPRHAISRITLPAHLPQAMYRCLAVETRRKLPVVSSDILSLETPAKTPPCNIGGHWLCRCKSSSKCTVIATVAPLVTVRSPHHPTSDCTL